MSRALPFAFILFVTPLFAANPAITFEPIATGLQAPVGIAHAGDHRLFFVLQAGRIVIYDGVRVFSTPFLDIQARVLSGGERGLLGLAFHPRFQENGFFFVNYTNLQGNTVIARYRVSASNPNVADSLSAVQLLLIEQPFANHNGGQLAFGPDGYLYIGMGDGGSGGDPGNRAQSMGDLLGKMLRIDVDGGNPYRNPPSNPFVNDPSARDEIWASGLRNPWRFSFDRNSGDLWIADVGQGSWEEVSFQPATSIGGENYGWRRMEGTHCFTPPAPCNRSGLVLPVIEYDHSRGCSVTGGYVYRGTRSPRLQGMYLYGDYCSGRIWGGTRNSTTGTVTVLELADTAFLISAFGEDANGEVYVANHSGAIHRIVDSEPLSRKRRAVRQ